MKVSHANGKSTTILIDERYCKGCHLCLKACPKKLFSKGERRSRGGYRMPEVEQAEECTGCLLCEMTCPDLAITVLQEEK